MDRISEVDRGCALRQLDQLALGREGEDPILVHRHPGMLEKLLGAFGVFENLDQVVDPRNVDVGAGLAFLVSPMRRQAALGLLMHRAAADLDFDPHLRIVDDRSVQRAVSVALGGRDIILEAAGNHRPAAVDQPERAITIRVIIDDDPECHDVRELLKADVPLGHFLPDRKGMLLASGDPGIEAIVGKIELQSKTDPVDQIAALFGQLVQAARNRGIGIGLQLPERERLHLGHHLVHSDPLGERGIDIHRLACDSAPLLLGRDVMENPHVVEPVGELHEQHPDVVTKRE